MVAGMKGVDAEFFTLSQRMAGSEKTIRFVLRPETTQKNHQHR